MHKYREFPATRMKVGMFSIKELPDGQGATLTVSVSGEGHTTEYVINIGADDVREVSHFMSTFTVMGVCNVVVDSVGNVVAFGSNRFIKVESCKAVVERLADANVAFSDN